MNGDILMPEDYEEPRCLLCDEPYSAKGRVKSIPQQRVIEKMDEYMATQDYAGAERHLKYWLEEARLGGDLRGSLMVRNELIGHYRKTGEKEKAYESGEEAVKLIDELDFAGTISAATTYINLATACNSFGDNERAYSLFRKAQDIYEKAGAVRDDLAGGLYNNMALTCVGLGRYAEADSLYKKAIERMKRVPGGQMEIAITYLNMADALDREKGFANCENEIYALLDLACGLLDDRTDVSDGYYAYVCDKCAPTFSYYGYFMEAEELKNRVRDIYERS